MKMPDICVVVCTYNRAEMLAKALACMVSQESNGQFSFEIVVVDDGSTDGTKGVVEQVAARSEVPIRYFREQGKGVSHARNRGIAESRGDWIAFFDQDQLAGPDWLKELFAMASKTGADVVDGPRDLAISEGQLSRLSSVCRRVLGEITGSVECAKRRIGDLRVACTGNVLINRRVFDAVGEFDESLIRGGEDWDFFRRVRDVGFEIPYAPKAPVHHLIPPERLTYGFFKWNSLRCGANFAYRDYKEWGRMKAIMLCVARIGQALLVNLPLLFWAYLFGDDAELLGRKCPLWRAVGYTHETLFLVAPRLFPQESFFAGLELRREREIFTNDNRFK